MRDPNTVAAIINALRQVHGDDLARVMLNDGVSLAVLIDALLRSPLKNRDAVKLITRATLVRCVPSPSPRRCFRDASRMEANVRR